MSGLIKRLRGKNENNNSSKEQAVSDDNQLAGVTNTALYTRHQGSMQEGEDRSQKGIDYDMIYAEQAVTEIEKLAHSSVQMLEDVPVKDDAGKVVYESVPARDSFGQPIYTDETVEANGVVIPLKKVVMVNQPKTSKELVTHTIDRLWAVSALVYIDTVMPTIWMGVYEADTAKMYVRTAFHDIRKQMRHDNTLTYEEKQNCILLLRAVRDLALFRCEDTKDGRKALLLKVRREELGVHMTKGAPNVKGGGK